MKEHIFNLNSFGKTIRNKMSENNLKVSDLSKETGITVQTLNRYINGQSCPTIYNLLKLSQFFKLPMEKLLIVDEKKFKKKFA